MIVLALTVNYPLAAEALRINTIANMKGVSAGSRAIRAVRRPIHSGFAPDLGLEARRSIVADMHRAIR
jgi:hypothetical protein